jgi:hypothetical protein
MKSKNLSIRGEGQNLSVRYGEIGISAVAAAMRYQGEGSGAARRESDQALKELAPEVAA